MKEPLYIIDSFALIFRAYFAFAQRPLTSPDGRNIGAFFGFFKMVFSLIRDHKIKNLAMAFDSKTPTFRHELYGPYKEHRDAAPQDLIDQIPLIEQIIRTLGIPIFQQDGFEADDLLASMAQVCFQEDRPCFIVSGDKDLMQLIRGPIRMLKPDKGGGFVPVGPEEVFEDKGVTPAQIVDFLSLLGDASDNIPGVKGIGEKTAAKLLAEFETLDNLYAHLDKVTSVPQRTKLEEGKDSAFLSRRLVILRDDLSIEAPGSECVLSWDGAPKARELFKTLGAKALVSDLDAFAPPSANGQTALEETTGQKPPLAQGDLFGEDLPALPPQAEKGVYKTISTLVELKSILAKAKEKGSFALDLETDSLDPWTTKIVGFSFSFEEKKAFYLPLLCPEGVPWTKDQVLPLLKELLETPGLKIVGQNFKFDWKVLKAQGIEVPSIWFDTMVAAFILDSSIGTYNLEYLSKSYLNYADPIPFSNLVPKGKTFADVPLAQAGQYGAEDADLTWRLMLILDQRLKAQGLDKIFYDVDMPVLDLLCRMEWEGIGLNPEELRVFSGELEIKIRQVEQDVFALCGKTFNLASPKQLSEILFTDRQLPIIRKTKTGYSTDSDVLQELALQDPVPALVLRHRLFSKLKSTYVDTLPLLVNPLTGRIHTQYNPTGAATGRLSSKDPNLQNIPIKDEEGRKIRKAFVPKPGHRFLSADYSQIELVLLAHLSGDKNLVQAFKDGQDIHRRTASLIFSVPEDQVDQTQRRAAKAVNFGIMYGMSAFRLAGELGIPRSQADTFIKTYFTEFSGIREFVDLCVAQAEKTGYSTTFLGRRRPIASINSRNKTEKMGAERVAVNSPIQGSAADLIKLAMLKVDKRLKKESLKAKILLQVHDELLLEVPESEIDRVSLVLKEEMEGAVELSVPLRTTVEVASNWGDLH